jgi:hypothetical protein
MVMGLLFLGGGNYTLGNCNRSIACLFIALYPKFPTSFDDSQCHVQAWRHLWVLAIEQRLLITRDVETKEIASVPIKVVMVDHVEISLVTPCLLPRFEQIQGIRLDSIRYWPRLIDPCSSSGSSSGRNFWIKKRSGHLSYEKDPQGQCSMVASSFPNLADEQLMSSFVQSISSSPQLLAFAQHFKGDFWQNVLYECLCFDKPEMLKTYAWLHQSVANLNFLRTSIWGLKMVLSCKLLNPGFIQQVKMTVNQHLLEYSRLLFQPCHGPEAIKLGHFIDWFDWNVPLPILQEAISLHNTANASLTVALEVRHLFKVPTLPALVRVIQESRNYNARLNQTHDDDTTDE